jgi:hypothetical protein
MAWLGRKVSWFGRAIYTATCDPKQILVRRCQTRFKRRLYWFDKAEPVFKRINFLILYFIGSALSEKYFIGSAQPNLFPKDKYRLSRTQTPQAQQDN